jgi:DNA mismatch endonuclease (patch repair protein)
VADIFDPRKRSQIMSRIRSAETGPEKRLYLVVRRVLGHRWSILQNVRSLPGQPDVVIQSLRVAIFADGCFYHCCPKHGHSPKTNKSYWSPKLERNAKRDSANRRKLRAMGYRVWRFWEHSLKKSDLTKVEEVLRRRIERLASDRKRKKQQ